MLEFVNVSKSFWTGTQRKVILDRASFRVELGNSIGILAKNGTGKTTIINMMAGLEKPDEGQIIKTCRVSFPLGFMGGVISKLSAMENAGWTQITSSRSAAGCAGWMNTLICRSAPTVRGCARASVFR